MPKLLFTISKCVRNEVKGIDGKIDCPFAGIKHTPYSGFGEDIYCKKMNDKITSGYVEWPSEINPIPRWCPLRVSKKR